MRNRDLPALTVAGAPVMHRASPLCEPVGSGSDAPCITSARSTYQRVDARCITLEPPTRFGFDTGPSLPRITPLTHS